LHIETSQIVSFGGHAMIQQQMIRCLGLKGHHFCLGLAACLPACLHACLQSFSQPQSKTQHGVTQLVGHPELVAH
jgi:hypothetical protein